MSKRSILMGLALAATLGGCGGKYSPNQAYTTPGWYLERPRLIVATGPEIFAGPFTYDKCEQERMKLDPATSSRMLCNFEKMKPGPYGPYTPSPPDAPAPRQG